MRINTNLVSNWIDTPKIMDFRVYSRIAARYGLDTVESRAKVIKKGNTLLVDAYDSSCHNLQFKSALGDKYVTSNFPSPIPLNLLYFRDSLLKLKPKHMAYTLVLGNKFDAFQWLDRKYSIAREILNEIHNSPLIGAVVINTRSDLIACDEYIETLYSVAMYGERSLTINLYTMDCEDAAICSELAPGSASQKRLMSAYNKLIKAGFKVNIILEGN